MSEQPSGKKGKTTIVDVARESGVSPATVSLVLRDKPGVGQQTRQRVFSIAEELGYIASANSNVGGRSDSRKEIGLVIKVRPNDLPATNQFYAPVISGIETVCRQHGSRLVYTNMPVDETNQPLEMPDLITQDEVDGLLLVGVELKENLLNHLLHKQIPVILVDAYASGDPYDSVVTDNFAGAQHATQMLIDNGHEKIAILGSNEQAYPSILERRNGYLAGMAEAGFSPIFADCELVPEVAEQVAQVFLKEHPEVTAVFACNDEVAIAVMKVARERGRAVPEDLAVIGFDNISIAQHISPALTTMRVDKIGMGRMAAQLIFNRLAHPESALVRAVIRPQLIVRNSA